MSQLEQVTIALSVSMHVWGTTRGIKSEQLIELMPGAQEQVREQYVAANKKLLKSKEYDKIGQLDRQAAKYVKERSLPSLFRPGIYRVPTALVQDIETYLAAYQSQREWLIVDFKYVYQDAVDQAGITLGALFNPLDYPSTENVVRQFYIEWSWLDLGVPGQLAMIDPAAFQRAQEQLEASMLEAEEHCRALLRAEVLDLTQGLYQALQGLDDGTLKRFHERHVSKVVQWVELFQQARNVTNDTELAGIVGQLRHAVLHAGDSTTLKEYATVRGDVKQALAGCLTEFKALTVACPVRQFQFDE